MNLSGLTNYKNKNGYPPSICVELIKKCNLTCPYCRSGSSPFEKDFLEFATLSKLLSDLSQICKWRISLTGGEPLLYSHLPNLIEQIVSHYYPFCLTTNGTQPISKLQRIPKEFWAKATLKISIDGNREIHDSYRGKGNYDKTINFIKEARSFIPRLIINSVLIQDGKIWGEEMYEVLNELKVDRWTVISPMRFETWNSTLEGLIKESYINQYNFFQKISADKKAELKVSFLDYSTISTTRQDIVFIKSNGQVFLPEMYEPNIYSPKKVSYKSENVVNEILIAANSFIETNKYIQ